MPVVCRLTRLAASLTHAVFLSRLPPLRSFLSLGVKSLSRLLPLFLSLVLVVEMHQSCVGSQPRTAAAAAGNALFFPAAAVLYLQAGQHQTTGKLPLPFSLPAHSCLTLPYLPCHIYLDTHILPNPKGLDPLGLDMFLDCFHDQCWTHSAISPSPSNYYHIISVKSDLAIINRE